MQNLLTEPEKYIEALLRCDRVQRQDEEIRRALTASAATVAAQIRRTRKRAEAELHNYSPTRT